MPGTIIPSVGAPGVAPNFSTTLELATDRVIGAGTVVYANSLEVMFRTGFGFQPASFTNAGAIWNRNAIVSQNAFVISASNVGFVSNSGLMVADSASGSARTIELLGSSLGIQNSGRIFAFAPSALAAAIFDFAGAPLANSGILAAQGRLAFTVYRENGGQVLNQAGGQILAEGATAVGVYVGPGGYGTAEMPEVENAGQIIANRTAGSTVGSIGVLLASVETQAMYVLNTGLISGDFAVAVDENVLSPTQHNGERLVNEVTGVIQGAIDLAGGDNIIINRGQINGAILLDDGDDIVDTSAGQFTGYAQLGWGQDLFSGGAGADVVAGDRGDDGLTGGAGADLLLGGRGNDTIIGGAGRDGLYGEFGDDVITTEGGDLVQAGAGNDRVVVGDYTFADLDGGDGSDRLVLASTASVISLSAVLSAGRIRGFESIELPGAQGLVITQTDVAAFTGSPKLTVYTGASGTLTLVGAWTFGGQVLVDGVTFRSYALAGAEVMVAGGGAVSVSATAPSGATGLDAVAAGLVAALPGAATGVELATSATLAQDVVFYRPLVIDADEQWISSTGRPVIGNGNNLLKPDVTNHGQITSTGASSGAVAVGGEWGNFLNFGSMSAMAAANAGGLGASISTLATYGLDNAIQNGAGNVYGFNSSFGAAYFLNAGSLTATSTTSIAAGMNVYLMNLLNEGAIAGRSANFVGVGIYAHNGGLLTNTGSITAEGDLGAYAIGASSHTLQLDNQGAITAIAHGAGAPSVGIDLYLQAGTSTITNSNLIQADVAIRTSFTVGGGGLDLYNSGQIVGRIELNVNPNGGSDRQDLIVNSGSISGDVLLGGEIDVFDGRGGVQAGIVFGEAGNDLLIGGGQLDRLNGGDGNDVIIGSGGSDQLTGGAGADLFVYRAVADSTTASSDLILDFESGSDVLDFSAFAPTSVGIAFAAGVSTITAQSAIGVIVVRVNGSVQLADVRTNGSPSGTSGVDVLLADIGGGALFGQDGDDLLFGSSSNDVLDGGAGADIMIGGSGNDTYYVNGGDVVRESPGGGVDTMIADEIDAAGLADNVENLVLLTATHGQGNALDNRITGNGGFNIIAGGGGDDEILAGGNLDFVDGDDGNDRLFGEDGDDSIRAGLGNDFLSGGQGNDLLDGGAGNDTFDGGAGIDTVSYNEGVFAGLIIDLAIAGPQDTGGGGVDTFISIENIVGADFDDWITGDGAANFLDGSTGNDHVFGGGGNDRLSGGVGDDAIAGGDGDDVMSGFLLDGFSSQDDGNDSFDGGGGIDTVSYASSTFSSPVNVSLAIVGAQNTGNAGVDTLVNVENLVGTHYGDTLTGNDQANVLSGEFGDDILAGAGGDDTLVGGFGNDRLDGGSGVDTASYATSDGAVTVNLLIVTPQANGAAGSDTLLSIENLSGSDFADTLTGSNLANMLNGGVGADVMTGGLGDDTYVVDNSADVVVELENEGFDRVLASATCVMSSYIEDLTLTGTANINGSGNFSDNVIEGNSGNNSLFGGTGNDTLMGAAGNDRLDGSTGADTMTGGTGDDIYIVDSVSDVVTEDFSAGLDRIDSSITYALGGNLENLVLTGTASINGSGNFANNTMIGNSGANGIYGGTGDDTLFGNDGNDRLDGATGNDAMKGGFGDDIYIVDSAGDVVTDEFNGGLDRVDASVSYALGSNVENLVLLGTANLNGSGNFLNNTIVGNAGNNSLFGGTGDDTLFGNDGNDRLDGATGNDIMKGGFGDDIYIVDSAGDVVTDEFNGGLDRVDASVSYTLGSNVENLVLQGTAALNGSGNFLNNTMIGNTGANSLYGGTGDDILFGNDGNDRLDGATGNDTMKGGLGDDIYIVDAAGDVTTEDVGQGTDRIDAYVSYTIGVNIENMVLQGAGNINGAGNFVNNTIIGNGGDNILSGLGGNDTLLGGAGNDQLDGGVGIDKLTGGAGADKFVFTTALSTTGIDQVLDFNTAEDMIWLDDAVYTGIATGALTASAFTTGSSATDALDRLVYDPTNGALYYDADGSGAGAAVQIATLSTGLALTATNFFGI